MKFKLAEHDFVQYCLEDCDPKRTYLPTVEISEEVYEEYKRTMKDFEWMQTALAALNCLYDGEDSQRPAAKAAGLKPT